VDDNQGSTQCGCPSLSTSRHTYFLPLASKPTQPSSATLQNAPPLIVPECVGTSVGGGGGGGAGLVVVATGGAGTGTVVAEVGATAVAVRLGEADGDGAAGATGSMAAVGEAFGFCGPVIAPIANVPAQHRTRNAVNPPPMINATFTPGRRFAGCGNDSA
jgi:hypothetical protein